MSLVLLFQPASGGGVNQTINITCTTGVTMNRGIGITISIVCTTLVAFATSAVSTVGRWIPAIKSIETWTDE